MSEKVGLLRSVWPLVPAQTAVSSSMVQRPFGLSEFGTPSLSDPILPMPPRSTQPVTVNPSPNERCPVCGAGTMDGPFHRSSPLGTEGFSYFVPRLKDTSMPHFSPLFSNEV